MLKRIITYIEIKRLERQIKYKLLSYLYPFLTRKEDTIHFFHNLLQIQPDNFYNDLLERVAEFAHKQAKKE